MKKTIYVLPMLFLGVIFLAGCNKTIQTQNSEINKTVPATTNSNLTEKKVMDKEVKTGDEEIDKEINEIDKVIDSIDSSDLEGDNLKDSELGI